VNDADREPIVAIAALAALSGGARGAEEAAEIEATAAQLFEGVARRAQSQKLDVQSLLATLRAR
jgi:hypothetical protein